MFKIAKVSIKGFWGDLTASCKFEEDINIIIGRNGSGKTTFINILRAVLSVNIEQLAENDFNEVVISLIDGKNNSTVRARKRLDNAGYQSAKYEIGHKEYEFSITRSEHDQYMGIGLHFLQSEQIEESRNALKKLVFLSSLSVYRLRSENDMEIMDRRDRRSIISPVDYRLMQQMNGLTRYQLEISKRVAEISNKLQKEVLGSILYDEQSEKKFPIPNSEEFDQKTEVGNLTSAYEQLQVLDTKMKKKIKNHIKSVSTAITDMQDPEKFKVSRPNIFAIFAYYRTKRIVDMSLKSGEEIKKAKKHLNLLLDIIHDFIKDKRFSLDDRGLKIVDLRDNTINVEKLSSGEKQLLILLTETLLQKERQHVFLADEPELSLHIEWQRNIIPSAKKINPNAQIIVATHSPEIAGGYKSSIIDMREIVK